MKKKVFICDQCQKEITGMDIKPKEHIRILMAEIRKDKNTFTPIINYQDENYAHHEGLHFCNPACLGKYFRNIWKKNDKTKSK